MKRVIEISEEDYNKSLNHGWSPYYYEKLIANSTTVEECEDCISRQAVIETIERWVDGTTKQNGSLMYMLEQLPSVYPKSDKEDITFKDDNAVSRLSVRDLLYANAYELEYPDGSSEYVINRDEAIKYVMDLSSVYPKCKADDCISRTKLKARIFDLPKPNSDKNYWDGVDDVGDLIDSMPSAYPKSDNKDYILKEDAFMALTGDITDCTIEEFIARLRDKLSKLPSADASRKEKISDAR